MGDAPAHVAVVGGGISGLVFARELASRGIRATVFDTGEKAVGGRASTRDDVDALGRAVSWDHSTQYFTATPGSRFEAMASEWLELGLVAAWPDDRVGVLDAASGTFAPFRDGATRYVGVGGLKALTSHLADAERVDVVRPKWVGAMTPNLGGGGDHLNDPSTNTGAAKVKWDLASSPGARGEKLGTFDFVAVAHNGKCAARLASTATSASGASAAPKLLASLQCAFGVRPSYELKKQRKLILSSVWALMLVFDEPLAKKLPAANKDMEGAHVVGSDVVAWCSNVTAKRRSAGAASLAAFGGECWVVHSTPTYARDNKCPQEAVPANVAAKVKKEMLAAFEVAAGLEPGTSSPAELRVQLWGAANPLTAANVPAVFDSETNTGACGDWCGGGPPCVEAAAESAMALADAVECVFQPAAARAPEAAAALDAARVKWSPCAGAGALGGFPGTEAPAMPEPAPRETGSAGGRGGGRGRGGRGGGRNGGRSGGRSGGGGRGGRGGQGLRGGRGGGRGRGKKASSVVSVSAAAYARVATAMA
jgi:predicted NAD/FAD-dependent oxidoreductase